MSEKPTYEELELRVRELEKAEKALQKSEDKFRRVFHTSPDAINLNRASDGLYIDINEGFTNIMGYSREDVIGKTSLSLNIWKNPEDRVRLVRGLSKNGFVENLEAPFVGKDGEIREGLMSASLLRINEEDAILSVTRNITKIKKAEAALQKSEKKYRELVEEINETIYSIDTTGTLSYVSPAIKKSLGYEPEDLIGRFFFEIVHPEDQLRIKETFQAILGGKTGPNEYRLQSGSGEYRWVRSSSEPRYEKGRPAGLRGVFSDITEEKRLQADLQQARKMESMGTLAGGLAHEFNNILGIIIGNAELAADDIPKLTSAAECLEEIRVAGLRAKDVVQKVLSFARKVPAKRRPIQIGPVIKDALKLLLATIRASIDIRHHVFCESEKILADPTEINQVLINLCNNSVDAMNGGTSDVLEIRLESRRLDHDATAQIDGLKPGRYVLLTVKDSGKGIKPSLLDRVLDPYFTTKDVDQGLGMGLAVVYGIVKKNDGAIKIKSKLAKGTIVEIFFPLIEASVQPETSVPEPFSKGSKRILLVD